MDADEGREAWQAVLDGFRESENESLEYLERSRGLANALRGVVEATVAVAGWHPAMYDLVFALGKSEAANQAGFDAAATVKEAIQELLRQLDAAAGDVEADE
jgi:hypothetical protein